MMSSLMSHSGQLVGHPEFQDRVAETGVLAVLHHEDARTLHRHLFVVDPHPPGEFVDDLVKPFR